ncbi:FAD-dependent oxidoreductase [Candidatus Woesearchaeota archaeon]|jgi:uncharacterized protein|nr:FAD-dependent oxidoreductase [Candidatus Woesearchaeota archaeon]
MKNYDVVIVGAGPSGLFAAEKLSHEDYNVLVIDKKRIPGGAGTLTDAKAIFHPKVGRELDELRITEERSKELDIFIEDYFLSLGVDPTKLSDADTPAGRDLAKKAAKHNLEFILSRTRHIGTDKAPEIMRRFKSRLEDNGVDFLMETGVSEIQHNKNFTIKLENGTEINSEYLMVGPGRGHSGWFREQADKLGIDYAHGPVQMGARIEIPKNIMDPITDISYDAKFYFKSISHNDKVRTFCVNPGGKVALESPQDTINIEGKKYQLVNGHSKSDNGTNNTNLAILVSLPLTEPETDPKEYLMRAIKNTYENGGGKPIAQRWGDLKRGSRSKLETFNNPERGFDRLKPTLHQKLFTPGDLSLAYSERFYSGIVEMIEQLDHVIPGFVHPSTLLYIPEVKFCDTVYTTRGDTLESSIDNLYVMGDGAGKSRGIVGAGLTGILAAESIIKKSN